MTSELVEQLEDLRIEMEVATLSDAEILPYLQEALRMWGVVPTSTTLEEMLEEAGAALEEDELTELARRGRDGRFIKGSGSRGYAPRRAKPRAPTTRKPTTVNKARLGKKMTGSIAQRLGHWVGTALARTATYAVGKVAQGAGHLLSKAKNKQAASLGSKLKGGSKNFIKKVMDL